LDKADPAIGKALKSAPEEAQQLMSWKLPTLARVVNGWSMNTDTMGVYGNYYLKRAIITQQGLGANLPQDAIYPINLADESGRPLDGANKYTLHFEKGDTPPADAFWSITLYERECEQRQKKNSAGSCELRACRRRTSAHSPRKDLGMSRI
jgi:hypothetical protein